MSKVLLFVAKGLFIMQIIHHVVYLTPAVCLKVRPDQMPFLFMA